MVERYIWDVEGAGSNPVTPICRVEERFLTRLIPWRRGFESRLCYLYADFNFVERVGEFFKNNNLVNYWRSDYVLLLLLLLWLWL